MKKIEDSHQMSFISWCRIQYPHIPIHSIPNDGYSGPSSAIKGAKRKRMGLVAGIPDIFVPHPGKNDSRGLYIEMKKPGGRLSPAQKERIAYLEQYYTVCVCYNVEEAIKAVQEYMG